MGQLGFFDLSNRYAGLDKFGDPLVLLKAKVPFGDFRAELKTIWRTPKEQRKSNAERKPFDEVLMFKVLTLQQLYNLSDDQIEYQIRDRLSVMRFLDLGVEDRVPDAKTVWLYREKLVEAGGMKTLFDKFDSYLRDNGYLAHFEQEEGAGRLLTPRLCRCRANTTNGTRTTGSRRVKHRKTGRIRPPKIARRTWMRAGRRSTAKVIMATKTTSMWTGGTNSSALMRCPTPACTTARRSII